jgi:hypothetical protein
MKHSIKLLAALVIFGLTSVSQAGVLKYEVHDGGFVYTEIKNSVSTYRNTNTYAGVLDERMKNKARAVNLAEARKQCSKFASYKVAKNETTYCTEATPAKHIARRTCYVKNSFLCK